MNALTEMLRSHPQRPSTHFDEVLAAIAACFDCAQACTMCADACIAEEEVADLRECIRLNLDCGDLCNATGRLIARQARPEPALWRATLEVCIEACRSCAAECARHEARHEHCRICKEACERCERACRAMIEALPEGGAESRH